VLFGADVPPRPLRALRFLVDLAAAVERAIDQRG